MSKPPDPARAEQKLEQAMASYRKEERAEQAASTPERQLEAKFRLGMARLKRDEAIRHAISAGLRRARIIAITELSSQRIDQIRRGKRL